MEITTKPHAAILSSPGMGHIIPVIQLGKRLVDYHGFHVTIFIVASNESSDQSQLLQLHAYKNSLEMVEFPAIDIANLVEPNANVVTRLVVVMREAVPALRSAISAMKCPPSVLIVDLFGTEALCLAEEFKISKYVYVATNARFLSFSLHVPTLHELIKGEFADQKEPLKIPGCKPVRLEDVVGSILDRSSQQYYEYLRICKQLRLGDGILLNTWQDLEAQALASIQNVQVYPIGPLVRPVKPDGLKGEMLCWLDKQSTESVLYVSFGSGGTMSVKQITELAFGLEQSQQRFIWVLRKPVENNADASFFSAGKEHDDDPPSKYLPDGFLTRTKESGFIVPNWAPQIDILSHRSVGGFMTHCGWNSVMESIVNGVPMIAWPLYAEQMMNATLLTEELGVAVRSEVLPTKAVVGRVEIEKMVRMIMEDKQGKGIRERVRELQCGARKALSEGGSSSNALSQLAKYCSTYTSYGK
ncbi:UDP-glucuronosyl/UDP-glucosyltransferase [Dillenia turbinata]|uniref:Glycosyltransferase n=1 Tax=Dillenia turbinata TaxID=194707 RepID=A0AAN8V349_9MAGN